MTSTNGTVPSVKGPSSLARSKFGPGMLLQHDDLEQLNTYTRDLSRLLFRSLLGCGVICGLVVKVKEDCGKVTVTIDAGVALGGGGDPIHVPKLQTVVLDEHCSPSLPSTFWVVLCGFSRACAPRTAMCPSDEDETSSTSTRERDWFEVKLVKDTPKCSCQCERKKSGKDDVQESDADEDPEDEKESCFCASPTDACYAAHYRGECGCDCHDCSGGGNCDCVVLAKLTRAGENPWKVNHSVRRLIRPVLMRDYQAELDNPKPKASNPPEKPKPADPPESPPGAEAVAAGARRRGAAAPR